MIDETPRTIILGVRTAEALLTADGSEGAAERLSALVAARQALYKAMRGTPEDRTEARERLRSLVADAEAYVR